jgi:DegV family protein with EDD domain
MTVKILTDSTSDITAEEGAALGISVIPLTVLFGRETFLDRVTITTDEFYRRLTTDEVFPKTTQPSPAEFSEVYDKLADETDEILVLTISSKLSGTYDSATSAAKSMTGKCRIEVIDSQRAAMGHGIVAIAAAEAAAKGTSLDELVTLTRDMLPRSHWVCYFDTLEYLAKGGRIGRAKQLLGSLLSFKQILTIKDGEVSPVTRRRSQAAGTEYLYDFVTGHASVAALAVEHTTLPDEADRLAARFAEVYPNIEIRRAIVSPVLGAYGGPNALAVTVLEGKDGA